MTIVNSRSNDLVSKQTTLNSITCEQVGNPDVALNGGVRRFNDKRLIEIHGEAGAVEGVRANKRRVTNKLQESSRTDAPHVNHTGEFLRVVMNADDRNAELTGDFPSSIHEYLLRVKRIK